MRERREQSSGRPDGRRFGTQVAVEAPQDEPVRVAPARAPYRRADRPSTAGSGGEWRREGQGGWRGGDGAATPRDSNGSWRGERNGASTGGRDVRRDGDWANRDRRRDGNWGGRDQRRDGNWSNGDRSGSRNGNWSNRDGNRYGGANRSRWDRNWRQDRRYDWYGYRNRYRNEFRVGRYYDPYGWSYRRFSIGIRIGSSFFGSRYRILDPWQYRLPQPYPGYAWVRYYNDVLLVDTWSGEVVDVIYDFFW
jgi:hypothetical protein